MNLFDQLVSQALANKPDLSVLRVVVEKELLHHDILKILSSHGLLKQLTFIGGTCLRVCHRGTRLSEDLDFTGGHTFTRKDLTHMGRILIKNLQQKYSLNVKVSEPVKYTTDVSTWKVKIETRPHQKHLPSQRINIDICAIPSYEKKPMLLINPYGVEMGTSSLIIQAQSREEIYADKLLALALRDNRIKYRDLWDILWLHQTGIQPNIHLIPKKLNDRNIRPRHFLTLFNQRQLALNTNNKLKIEFQQEMQRFLPTKQVQNIIANDELWQVLTSLLKEYHLQLARTFKN